MIDLPPPALDSVSPEIDQTTPKAARARFLEVFLSQRPQMEALVSRRVGCRATAADLVQDLFVRFWRRPLVEVVELNTYLLRCAGNIAIDHLRNEGTRARLHEELIPDEPELCGDAPGAALEASNDLRHIEAALRGLPEKTRQIFLLNRIHGRKYGEIATVMGLSQSAVEKHMMRALQACKASLEQRSARLTPLRAKSGDARR
jgi:RNA polymerase sigma-70 factor (ECF subfamily)